ncbi:MAG TPA: hypothetical protein V6D47_17660, partial [Oscillatoriaceae cyanobacterium]
TGIAAAGFEVKSVDNVAIRCRLTKESDSLQTAIEALQASSLDVPIPDAAIEDLKFNEALPVDLARMILATRWRDEASAQRALAETLRVCHLT